MILPATADRAHETSAETYHLYGLRLRSEWPLPFPTTSSSWLAEVALRNRSAIPCPPDLDDQSGASRWFQRARLPDDALYLRWPDLFEFLVSPDGREIAAHPLADSLPEIFHTYMLGHALSFALVKQGFEPLHATAVDVGGKAVAFLAEGGYGKTSLGAAFLQAGHRLLTDDLLVLSESGAGMVAYPGPPRIKLYPEMASRLIPQWASGTPISRQISKLVIPLEPRQVSCRALPLGAIYVLTAPRYPRTTVAIRRLSMRRACLALIQNTFNTTVTEPARLVRQLAMVTSVANRVPVKLLAYPRHLDALPTVSAAVLADVNR